MFLSGSSPLERSRALGLALTGALLIATAPATLAQELTVILGQPTDRSITAAVRASVPLEVRLEIGSSPGTAAAVTPTQVLERDPNDGASFVTQIAVTGLLPDTRYYYRLGSRTAGSAGAFASGSEQAFQTRRRPGSTFVFCAQGDSHPERAKNMFNSGLYAQTLAAVAREQPDFHVTSGDDFSVDTLTPPYTRAAVAARYALQLQWLSIVGRTAPLFLVNGNHEQASLWNYQLAPDANNSRMVPVWAQNARNLYFPQPAPNDVTSGAFYSGNQTPLPEIGPLRNYYAWEWGDALFVVIDPFWSSTALVDNGLGGEKGTAKTQNRWLISHGDAQYGWLKRTLEQSTARWKFVFAHHVMGTGRGGVEAAGEFEWGGRNADGTDGFAKNRPGWPAPIHELFVRNGVTIFFQAHDHLFARQQLDGVTYQSLPNPADDTYTAFNADAYRSGDVLPNSGYVKVTVSPHSVRVDYIRQFLPEDESAARRSGTVAHSYTIGGSSQSPRRRAVTPR